MLWMRCGNLRVAHGSRSGFCAPFSYPLRPLQQDLLKMCGCQRVIHAKCLPHIYAHLMSNNSGSEGSRFILNTLHTLRQFACYVDTRVLSLTPVFLFSSPKPYPGGYGSVRNSANCCAIPKHLSLRVSSSMRSPLGRKIKCRIYLPQIVKKQTGVSELG